jgi:hypothetical protein
MAGDNSIAGLLADIVYDTCWGNRWHRLAEATEGLTREDLAYRPVPSLGCDWGDTESWPRLLTPRRILWHLATGVAADADVLAPQTTDAAEAAWDALGLASLAENPQGLVEAADAAMRRFLARARTLRDGQLGEPVAWDGLPDLVPRATILAEDGILHPPWHLGQLALLIGWQHGHPGEPISPPGGRPSSDVPYQAGPDLPSYVAGSRTEACLRVLAGAYRESPWHSIRRTVEGLTEKELSWSPFPDRWGPGIARHVADCKVMDADQAFGEGKLDWPACARLIGTTWERPEPEKLLAALDRAQEFLVEHVAAATDADLDLVNPMHHGVPHTGWQVVATMAQHDAWHAGQIAIMRDVYAALAEEEQP